MVKPGAAVLDVGVSRVDGKVAGDVAADVADVAGWISPNPGGVGADDPGDAAEQHRRDRRAGGRVGPSWRTSARSPTPTTTPIDVDDAECVVEPVDPAAAVAPGEDEPRRRRRRAATSPSRRSRGGTRRRSVARSTSASWPWLARPWSSPRRSDWRLGIQILGGSLLAAALLRLMLANRDAGMLAVRNRFLDAFLLGALASR